MKKLEEALTNLSLPDIRVDKFKQELRRDLMNAASREAQSGSWRFAFGFALFAAVVFVFTTFLFVFKPEVPARLNAWMIHENTPVQDARVAADAPNLTVDPNSAVVQELLNQGLSTDADREFVKTWYREQYPSHPFQVESVEDEKIYAIRRFNLKGGKKVVVYTEVQGNDGLTNY